MRLPSKCAANNLENMISDWQNNYVVLITRIFQNIRCSKTMEKQKCCAGQEVIWNKCELWDLLYCPSLFTVNRCSHCSFKIGFLCLFVYVHVRVCVYIYTCMWGKIKDTEVVGKQTCQQGAVWSLQRHCRHTCLDTFPAQSDFSKISEFSFCIIEVDKICLLKLHVLYKKSGKFARFRSLI